MSSDSESSEDPVDYGDLGKRAIESLADRPNFPHRDPEVLKSYLDDGYTYRQIADELRVHPSTIGEWVREQGLNR